MKTHTHKTELKMNKTKTQTKPTVDREVVRMLAIELGAREAARRLGIKESTVLSWAKRCDWKLPKRKGDAISAIKLHSKPGDALIAAHEELEGATKTALMQTLAKAAQQVAGKQALDVSNTAQLRATSALPLPAYSDGTENRKPKSLSLTKWAWSATKPQGCG